MNHDMLMLMLLNNSYTKYIVMVPYMACMMTSNTFRRNIWLNCVLLHYALPRKFINK